MHTVVDREGDTCIEREEEVAYISVCVHPVVEAVSVSSVRLQHGAQHRQRHHTHNQTLTERKREIIKDGQWRTNCTYMYNVYTHTCRSQDHN